MSDDAADFKSRVKDWASALRGNERIAGSIMRPAVMADLAGQLFVRNVELAQNKRLLDDGRRPAFLTLPFQEALDFWVSQGGSRETLTRVLQSYRDNADAATSLMLDTISQRAIDRIEATLADGKTFRDFAIGMQQDTISLGISPMSSSYLETVFRTNVQTAYGAGRFQQLTEPAVIALRPWVQYRTAGDNRVRENHRALDGVIFDASSSEWHAIAPPCGFNCRCSFVSLDDQDVHDELTRGARMASGVDNIAELIRNGPDDESFAGPPTQPIAT